MGRIRSEDTTLVSVRIPKVFKVDCEIKASKEHISFNEWIRRAMEDKFSDSTAKLHDLLEAAELKINQLKMESELYKNELETCKINLETVTKENTQLAIELALLKANGILPANETANNIAALEILQRVQKEAAEKTQDSILKLMADIEDMRKEIDQLKATQ